MSTPFMLFYDIPQGSKCPNPSNVLRPIAFRLNLSCWCINESDMPYELLGQFNEFGVRWHTLKFDSKENAKLIQLAIESFQSDIRDYVAEGMRTARNANRTIGENGLTPYG